ncbi:MAG: hypothetical protein FWE20_11360 [Defluviitaleaceae bacterium]|nr:hypothetical protein [Defluviitaleaceae bacterium]
MAKNSQLDPKEVRKAKAKGGPRIGQSELDGKNWGSNDKSGNKSDV